MRAFVSAICHLAVRKTMNVRCWNKVTHRFALELFTWTCGGSPADGTTVIGGDWIGVSGPAAPQAGDADASTTIAATRTPNRGRHNASLIVSLPGRPSLC